MNFLKYLSYRIAARESEKIIYKGADSIKELEIFPQFPTLGGSILWGILTAIGLGAWYGIISLFEIPYINWIIPVVLGLLIAINLVLKKFTNGMKQEELKVKDRRYKTGYRIEYKEVPDHSTLVQLLPKHRVFNTVQALIILAGVASVLYSHFVIGQ